jgi:hypothetical protein
MRPQRQERQRARMDFVSVVRTATTRAIGFVFSRRSIVFQVMLLTSDMVSYCLPAADCWWRLGGRWCNSSLVAECMGWIWILG